MHSVSRVQVFDRVVDSIQVLLTQSNAHVEVLRQYIAPQQHRGVTTNNDELDAAVMEPFQ